MSIIISIMLLFILAFFGYVIYKEWKEERERK